MRVDANISVRPRGSSQMNTKVEVKNMNSVRHVGDAIAFEIARQSAAVDQMYALIIVTGLIGWLLNIVLSAGERRLLHWHPSQRERNR